MTAHWVKPVVNPGVTRVVASFVAGGFRQVGDVAELPADLAWMPGYGFDCWRPEDDGTVTAVRFVDGDERVVLVNSTRNYLINAEVSYPMSDRGLAWLAAAVTS